MSNPLGCNQHRHAPGCACPQAPWNRGGPGNASPWGMYVPDDLDDEMTAASHAATHEIYVRLTQITHTPAGWPSDDDRDAAEAMPWPECRDARLAIAVRTEAMERRKDGRTPPPHPPSFGADEVTDARRAAMRARVLQDEAERLPEVDIDLMST